MPLTDALLVKQAHIVINSGPDTFDWELAVRFASDALLQDGCASFHCVQGDDGRYTHTVERIKLIYACRTPGVPLEWQFIGIRLADNPYLDPPRPYTYAIGYYTLGTSPLKGGSGWFDYYHDSSVDANDRTLIPKVTLSWALPADDSTPLRSS